MTNIEIMIYILIPLCSALLGAYIGGKYTLKGSIYATTKAHENNIELEKRKEEIEEKTLIKFLHDSFEEVLDALTSNISEILQHKNKYGFFEFTFNEAEYMINIIDGVINKVGMITNERIRVHAIKLYSRLKSFVTICNLYNEKITQLKELRKKYITKEQFEEIKYIDYFGINDILYKEENKPDTKLSKEFIQLHRLAIQGLQKKSTGIEQDYYFLREKLEEFLEMTNGRE